MTFRRTVAALTLGALSTVASADPPSQPIALPSVACLAHETSSSTLNANALVSGIDLSAMDRSIKPQDNFFEFVNGHWLTTTPIPADKSRYGMFDMLADKTRDQLQTIIKMAAEHPTSTNTPEQQLADMYKSYMNEALIEELSSLPLAKELADIQNITKLSQVATTLGHFKRLGVTLPLDFYVYPDAKKPTHYGFWLSQSGLTLPDRDYYLKDGQEFIKARQALADYAHALLKQGGYPKADEAAGRILTLETEIATLQMSQVEARDAEKNYNKASVKDVTKLLGPLDWQAFAQAAGCDHVSTLIVENHSYFEKLGALFAKTDVATWRDYLAFHLLDGYAPYLSSPFVNLHFSFHGTTLHGTPQNLPRERRAVDATSSALGEVLGKLYVERYFSPQAKARMQELVANLTESYGQSIRELTWMSEVTKKKALDKLRLFKPKIGYPDQWRDYSKLTIDASDLVGNIKRSTAFELDYQLHRAGKPVEATDWGMTPQTVNAYYSPTRNEIVFPAAILQPPFFNMKADDAVNYGGIGGVIGHEIGHGFDDQGSKYDGKGYLRNWWTPADRKAFDALGSRLAAQYNTYSPIEGLHVNGKLTLGENIGDLAGVTIGLKAYQNSLKGQAAPVIDGFTGEQRFFLGWAQVWRSKIREDALRARLLSDPHSPPQYRVDGPLRQVDEFYQAFDVKEGDGMYLAPEDRVKMW